VNRLSSAGFRKCRRCGRRRGISTEHMQKDGDRQVETARRRGIIYFAAGVRREELCTSQCETYRDPWAREPRSMRVWGSLRDAGHHYGDETIALEPDSVHMRRCHRETARKHSPTPIKMPLTARYQRLNPNQAIHCIQLSLSATPHGQAPTRLDGPRLT
jgi:hypothetical protein